MPNSTHLFSYGTLRQDEVQIRCFGRLLNGRPDALAGYVIEEVTISDPEVVAASGKAVHPVLRPAKAGSGELVDGMALEITGAELLMADAYETADYRRILLPLVSGLEAWVYVSSAVDDGSLV